MTGPTAVPAGTVLVQPTAPDPRDDRSEAETGPRLVGRLGVLGLLPLRGMLSARS